MKAIDAIHSAMKMSDNMANRMFEDMRDAPMTEPTARGGNHPLWVLGHLAHTEGFLYSVITGEPNPVKDWSGLFGMGSEPTADAARYPSYDEILTRYRQQRERNLALLNELGDAALDAPPKNAPAGFDEIFPTNGDVFLGITMHQQFHLGQVADARRAAGRAPLHGSPESVTA